MNNFLQTSASVPNLREANKLQFRVHNEAERVKSASLVGLWLLIPFALGAVAYLLIGIVLILQERFSGDFGLYELTVPILPWLMLTLVLQAAYWSWLSTPWQKGLWALIPIVGLVPTFMIARQALIRGQIAPSHANEASHQ